MASVQDSKKTEGTDEFVEKFWTEQEKLAAAEGVHVLVYMARAHGGILKGTIIKMLKHAQAHPDKCPDDCPFEASLERLKEKYSAVR